MINISICTQRRLEMNAHRFMCVNFWWQGVVLTSRLRDHWEMRRGCSFAAEHWKQTREEYCMYCRKLTILYRKKRGDGKRAVPTTLHSAIIVTGSQTCLGLWTLQSRIMFYTEGASWASEHRQVSCVFANANTWSESYASGHIHLPWLINRMRITFNFWELLIREDLAHSSEDRETRVQATTPTGCPGNKPCWRLSQNHCQGIPLGQDVLCVPKASHMS